MEKFLIFIVVLVGAFLSVSALQCYECYNCPDSEVKEEHLVTCGAVTTTPPLDPGTTTTTTGAPVDPGTTTTTTVAPVDPGTTTTTTVAPVDPGTTTTTTVAPVDPGTTTTTTVLPVDPGTTTTTTVAPVDPGTTTTTTVPPVDPGTTTTTTVAPVDPGTTTTTTVPPVDPGTTTTTTVPPVDPGTTTATNVAPVDPGNPDRNKYYTMPPQAVRVRRHVQPEVVELGSECTCNGGQCTCAEDFEVLKAFQYADDANATYVCAKATVKVNGTDVTARGCATPKLGDQEFCEFLTENANATNCITCTTDKCNSAVALQHSIGVLLVLALVAYIK